MKRRTFIQVTGAGAAVAGSSGAMGVLTRGRKPNVVMIVSDQQRRDSCGCYGSPVRRKDGSSPTPVIDRLAVESVRFARARCNSPLCAPSRASYHTGTFPHTDTALYHRMDERECGVVRFPGIREGLPTLAEVFRRGGYRTAGIGKMHVHGELDQVWDMGFDVTKLRFYTVYPGKHYADEKGGDLNARYREYQGYEKKTYREIDPVRFKDAPEGLTVKQNKLNTHYLETLVEQEEEMFDHRVTTESIAFIEECVKDDKPFFIHVGLEKPHPEWTTFKRFLDEFEPNDMPLPDTIQEWMRKGKLPTHLSWIHNSLDGQKARNTMAAYYACVADLDEQVGRILDRCKQLGIEDNTVFVFTTDHGEMLFDHGLRGKHNMYEEAVSIPLMIKYAKVFKPGSVCGMPVSLVDVFPTLTDICDLPAPSHLEGVPLQAVAAGSFRDRTVFSEFYQAGYDGWPGRYVPIRMACSGRWKYIYTHGCIDQLFDLKNDPKELNNLVADPSLDKLRMQLRFQTLESWEIDTTPQFTLEGSSDGNAVVLKWESLHPQAVYCVYRDGKLIKKNLSCTSFADTAGGTYRVLATVPLARTYKDHLGHSRYGDRPVMTEEYPEYLPISAALEIQNKAGVKTVAKYKPWNGGGFEGKDWTWSGYRFDVEGGAAVCRGNSFITAGSFVKGDQEFSALVRTVKPGGKPTEQGSLLLCCSDTDHFYRLMLQGDGTLALEKSAGLWKVRTLKKKGGVAADPQQWARLGLRIEGKTVVASVNGKEAFRVDDPKRLPPGRPGFCIPRYTKEFQFKETDLS